MFRMSLGKENCRESRQIRRTSLTEPIVSISRTVLKALAERPEMGEMKLPAAPALKTVSRNAYNHS
jgi:hypothetical protein